MNICLKDQEDMDTSLLEIQEEIKHHTAIICKLVKEAEQRPQYIFKEINELCYYLELEQRMMG